MTTETNVGPNREGEKRIARWLEAIEQQRRAKEALTRADLVVREAALALAQWGLPHDAMPGELFVFFVGGLEHKADKRLVMERTSGPDKQGVTARVALVSTSQGKRYTDAETKVDPLRYQEKAS